MSLCLTCKYGHSCPYMENIEDFVHIMVNEDELLQRLQEKVEKYNLSVGRKYRFKGPLAERGIELGLEISHCEGFQRALF
jgi:hypothetical protein